MDYLLRISASRGNVCSNVPASKDLRKFVQCVTMRLECEEKHRIPWTLSPRFPNAKLLVDYRLAHAALTTGLLPVQYEQFSSVRGIGHIGYRTLDSIVDEISQVSKVLADDSTQEALRCEILENHSMILIRGLT